MNKQTLKTRIGELLFDGKKTKEIFEIVKTEYPTTSYSSVAFYVSTIKKQNELQKQVH